MILHLTPLEKQSIAGAIKEDFERYVAKYDSYKYPEDIYNQLCDKFRDPNVVAPDDIEKALRWKYGHWHKKGYPTAHRVIIKLIQKNWRSIQLHRSADPKDVFNLLLDALQGHQVFITVSFLLHLLRSDEIPIIDQHNFRAMNYWLSRERANWRCKKKPSQFDDLLELQEFIDSILDYWPQTDDPASPDRRLLDKYLMVFGRELKRRPHPHTPILK